jgi:hypothetical protein
MILNDLGSNFAYYKDLSISDADSGIYGSLCLAPPCVGAGGLVYWSNGNYALPSIFGTGYPIITETFDGAKATVPIFRPHVRVASRNDLPLLPAAASVTSLPFKMNIKHGGME